MPLLQEFRADYIQLMLQHGARRDAGPGSATETDTEGEGDAEVRSAAKELRKGARSQELTMEVRRGGAGRGGAGQGGAGRGGWGWGWGRAG